MTHSTLQNYEHVFSSSELPKIYVSITLRMSIRRPISSYFICQSDRSSRIVSLFFFYRLRHRTDDDITVDIKDTRYGCVEWIYLAQDTGSGGNL
jgi:hypothetical protein